MFRFGKTSSLVPINLNENRDVISFEAQCNDNEAYFYRYHNFVVKRIIQNNHLLNEPLSLSFLDHLIYN